MREDCETMIKKVEPLIKICEKSTKTAALFFAIVLLFGGLNIFYLYASHQTVWFSWATNLLPLGALIYHGIVIWKNYTRWVSLKRAKAHLYAAGVSLNASAFDHHIEQADASLAAVE